MIGDREIADRLLMARRELTNKIGGPMKTGRFAYSCKHLMKMAELSFVSSCPLRRLRYLAVTGLIIPVSGGSGTGNRALYNGEAAITAALCNQLFCLGMGIYKIRQIAPLIKLVGNGRWEVSINGIALSGSLSLSSLEDYRDILDDLSSPLRRRKR